jgi:hypothetical protein
LAAVRKVVISCDRADCESEFSLRTLSVRAARKEADAAGWWFGLTKPGDVRMDICPDCCAKFARGED